MKSVIIIPTYNEIDNIGKITKKILETVPNNLDIIIVDDNSDDGTAEIIDRISNKRIIPIHRKSVKSFGGSYKDGFNFALNSNYDYIFEMDADFSHPVKMLPILTTDITSVEIVATDAVDITKAQYDSKKNRIIFQAARSGGGEATLEVFRTSNNSSYGQMSYNLDRNLFSLTVENIYSNPGTVIVKSSLGGEDTKEVTNKFKFKK